METIESVINDTPANILIRIGRQVSPASDAIKNWDNKREPKYFRNPETLIEAICRAWQNGNYQQKRMIVSMIDDGGL
jgi:hypothetical protein